MIKRLSHFLIAGGAAALLTTNAIAIAAEPEPEPGHERETETETETETGHESEPERPTPAPTRPTTVTAPEVVVAPEGGPPAPRRFEIALTGEGTWLVSDSAAVTSSRGSTATPQVRIGWSPLERLDVYAGYRALTEISRDDRQWDLTTDGDAIVVGARGRLPILPWLAAVAELDLEAMHVDIDLAVASRVASSSDWTFGVIPKIGIEAGLDVGFADLVLRVEGGWAWRLPLAVDDVRLSSEAESVVALDLGTLDLSGPVFAVTLALRF